MAILAIGRVQQRASYWCWAACGEMIARHFKLGVTQCQMVDRCFGGATTACQSPESVNVPVKIPQLTPQYASWGLHNGRYDGPLHPTKIAAELAIGRPIIALVALGVQAASASVQHTVLITGYDPAQQIVHRIDPFPGGGMGWIALASMHWLRSWADFQL